MSYEKIDPSERAVTSPPLWVKIATALGWMIGGHLLFSWFPWGILEQIATTWWASFDAEIGWFILAGFLAQMIDGALGMAYGVSATTFLLSVGISPAAASASVHASEIFTSGVSGLSHLKFGNVNKKLFRHLLLPGVLGSAIGAFLLSTLEPYNAFLKPLIALYTFYLGIRIILKITRPRAERKPIKRLGWLAWFGGFFDAVGGGGWGPIVSSTLIANGRNPVYTIGSVNLTEFFVSLASSVTFIFFLGLTHWQVILGLIVGGVLAAPFSAIILRKIPLKPLFVFVGILVIAISLRNLYSAFQSLGY